MYAEDEPEHDDDARIQIVTKEEAEKDRATRWCERGMFGDFPDRLVRGHDLFIIDLCDLHQVLWHAVQELWPVKEPTADDAVWTRQAGPALERLHDDAIEMQGTLDRATAEWLQTGDFPQMDTRVELLLFFRFKGVLRFLQPFMEIQNSGFRLPIATASTKDFLSWLLGEYAANLGYFEGAKEWHQDQVLEGLAEAF